MQVRTSRFPSLFQIPYCVCSVSDPCADNKIAWPLPDHDECSEMWIFKQFPFFFPQSLPFHPLCGRRSGCPTASLASPMCCIGDGGSRSKPRSLRGHEYAAIMQICGADATPSWKLVVESFWPRGDYSVVAFRGRPSRYRRPSIAC